MRATTGCSTKRGLCQAVLLVTGWLLACAPASAALLVFNRTVEADAPYYTDIALDAAGNIHLSGFVVVDDVPRAFVTKRSPDGASELWSLQFGAGTGQIAAGIDVDAQGNVYVTGWTADPNFPLKNPLQATFGGGESDVFILKVNAAGTSLVYSTFLGGAGDDFANQIRVDVAGSVHVTGTTGSANFPGAGSALAGETDAFAVKLNAAGSALVYSRLLGGGTAELGNGLALDAQSRAYLVGSTTSTNFPVMNPLQAENKGALDVFVTILDAAGATEYATYLGGSALEYGSGIAVDDPGNILVTGLTFSGDFPLVLPLNAERGAPNPFGGADPEQLFLAKLNADGSALEFSTFLIGEGEVYALALTPQGGVVVAGQTGGGLTLTADAWQRTGGFVLELNPSLSAVAYSTRLGDTPVSLTIDANGGLAVAGTAGSLRTTHAGFVPEFNSGSSDAFAMKLDASRRVLYSIPIGEFGKDDGRGVAFLPGGDLALVGFTASYDFPLVDATRESLIGGEDAFVTRISEAPATGGGNGSDDGELVTQQYRDRDSANLPRRFYRVRELRP